jgi:hypothetical protein
MVGGEGVAYSDTASHFSVVDATAAGDRAVLRVTLVREDGSEPYSRTFEQPLPPPPRRRGRRRRRRRAGARRGPPRYTG